MAKQNLWHNGLYGVAVVFATFAAYLDLHTDDNQFIALSLLVFGGLLGLAQPAKAWRWALILGLPIPIVEFIGRVVAGQTLDIKSVSGPFMALIFAFAGAYIGAFVSKSLKKEPLEQ